MKLQKMLLNQKQSVADQQMIEIRIKYINQFLQISHCNPTHYKHVKQEQAFLFLRFLNFQQLVQPTILKDFSFFIVIDSF